MSEPLERWNEDAPQPFRAAKAAYARLGPDAEQLERMLGQVEQAAAGPSAAGPSRAWFGAEAWHWLLPVLSALGVAWLWVASRHEPVVPAAAPMERAALPAAPAPSASLPDAVETAATPDLRGAPAVTASARAPRAPARPAPDPLAELALLDRARRVLAKDPTRALALASEHARDYPSGQFAEERELLAIEALVRLGRRSMAERRARTFGRAHPNSVHAHRLGVFLSPAAL